MKAVIASRPGGPDVLQIVDRDDPVAGAGEVLVRVRATAVNRADAMQRQGSYPPPTGSTDVLGLEAAGVIEAIGPGVDGWAVGDRVMALLSGGGYAELVAVPVGQLLAIPERFTWILAAAIPEVFLTAWQALGRQAPAGPGDWVLVHAGASGVGTAALQIARERGARTIATTRSAAKAEAIAEMCDHVIVPAGVDFADRVLALTDGHGADIVIDLVGASYWAENLRALAMNGRVCLIGMVGGSRIDADLGALLAKRATVIASTLRARPADEKAALVASFGEWGLPRFADGRLVPVIHDMLPLSRAADAHRLLEADDPIGKIVLAVGADGLETR
jgi:putative PIG3 family NAD(P)H quinone oxidoreductase